MPKWWLSKITSNGSHPWNEITTIGLDLAKNVFQVHGVDEAGNVVVRKRLRRSQALAFFAAMPRCLVGMEACATAHHWARELTGLGHQARLMPPNYVKAYAKRNKHDVADAEAICEAVKRPSMRFVPLKTVEQQSALMMHRTRDLLIRQRTMLVNALRGHMAEFGLVEAQGLHKVAGLIAIVMNDKDERIPDIARQALKMIVPARSTNCRCESLCLRRRYSLGTGTTRSVNVWPPFRGSGRSSPQQLQRQ